jgi:hypothetical protein
MKSGSNPTPDAWRWDKVIAIILLVFAIVFAAAHRVVQQREQSCASKCRLTGFSGYVYKGFAGSGRYGLLPDHCSCTNAGGSPTRAAE